MKPLIYNIITLIIFNLLTSCSGFQLEEEIPNTFEFQEQVFITGLFTNELDFATLDIQKTIPADSIGFNPVNNAKVALFSRDASNATKVLVTDSFVANNGKYISSQKVTTTIGNTYWAEITLEDGTRFKSEEEILKSPIALTITDATNNDDGIRVTIGDPIDEDNFYLLEIQYFENNKFLSHDWGLIDDANNESELFFTISNQNEGVTVKVNLYNINFTTFQFYNNSLFQLNDEFEIFGTPLRNLYGNIMNTTIDKVALGNYGIVGASSVTKEF